MRLFLGVAIALLCTQGFSADFSLHSKSFEHAKRIPSEYTCRGADRSPELHWANAPAGTQSFALIVDDPDAPDPKAPKMTWVHWVVFNIPADTNSFPDNAAQAGQLNGATVGINDWKRPAWGGPCPPIGEHRYFFKLYALDTLIDAGTPMDKSMLLERMKGHVLAETQLMGTYIKQ